MADLESTRPLETAAVNPTQIVGRIDPEVGALLNDFAAATNRLGEIAAGLAEAVSVLESMIERAETQEFAEAVLRKFYHR
jgi:hypothetical protein